VHICIKCPNDQLAQNLTHIQQRPYMHLFDPAISGMWRAQQSGAVRPEDLHHLLVELGLALKTR
jgi:hypothetical protein